MKYIGPAGGPPTATAAPPAATGGGTKLAISSAYASLMAM